MNQHDEIANLAPQGLWKAFVELNAVPRPSKKEAAVTKFIADRGRALGLKVKTDSIGNVLICKPASAGFENHPTVVLQSHLDMVCQKNADTDFDFETQGIQMWIDGDWVRARGTTLGSDNGIGVATMLATLAATDLKHPPLECLFTIDEETGMTGAKQLDATWLQGKILLNLDTEQDNELTIGCAGGADVTAVANYSAEKVYAEHKALELRVRGLTGGHSGVDIHLGRGNANKIMNRILWEAARKFGLRLASLDGGSLRNAIPRESIAKVVVTADQLEAFCLWIMKEALVIRLENEVTDPQLQVLCQPMNIDGLDLVPQDVQRQLFASISGCISGIYRMSPSIPGLVQSSNNLAKVVVGKGQISIQCLSRSSVDSERDELTRTLSSVLEQLGTVTVSGQYPGWQPEPDSQIVHTMREIYTQRFKEPPHVAACHAGLECGIIGAKFPGMEMISFGPTILGAHSPDERVQISSVQKFFGYYVETLGKL